MQISLSSGSYAIISHGQVFLFGANYNFKIHIVSDNEFDFFVNLKFRYDSYEEQRINKTLEGNVINLICYNFEKMGTGLTKPMSIAKIGGKELYLMFWSYLEGDESGKVRSVKYTIFMSDKSGDDLDEK